MDIFTTYNIGSFQDEITYLVGSSPESIAVADFNNDNRLDIVVSHGTSNEVSVLLAHDNEVFVKQASLTISHNSKPRSFITADFDNDDHLDLVVAYSGTNTIAIFLGHGNISFSTPTIYTTGSSSSLYAVAVADFNGDRYADIVVANYGSNNIGVFLGYGNGSFGNYTTYPTDSNSYSLAVGDFDNDFISDIIVVYYNTNKIGLLYGCRDGIFSEVILIQLEYGSGPFSVVMADYNNDRKLDFVVANNGADNLQVFLQTC